MDTQDVWRRVSELISYAKSLADDSAITIVANSKTGNEGEADYDETSLISEYFSSDELNQLLSGFRKHGFFVGYFAGELEFIRADLSGQLNNAGRRFQIVYNTAQTGIGAGRKALIPAYCARRGIHVCNSDPYVVSLVRHKFHVHCILKRFGLPTANTWLFQPGSGWLGDPPPSGQKLIAKAAFESASIGLTPDCVGELSADLVSLLIRKCAIYDQPFVVQQLIEGFEVDVPLLELDKMRALDVVSITLDGKAEIGDQILHYNIVDREEQGFSSSEHLSSELRSRIARIAEHVTEALGIRGLGRVDLRIDRAGRPYVIDVSTSPHLVRHGTVAHAFEWHGHPHSNVFAAMIGANARRWFEN